MFGVSTRRRVKDRAGTVLSRDQSFVIYGPNKAHSRQIPHGKYDPTQALYQGGGERDRFVFQHRRQLSLALEVWQQIRRSVRTLEMVDHDQNLVYRIDGDVAAAQGAVYEAGIGQRWGIPLAAFEVRDQRGTLIRAAGQQEAV